MQWNFSPSYSVFVAAIIAVAVAIFIILLRRSVDAATLGTFSTQEFVVDHAFVPLHLLVSLWFAKPEYEDFL